MVKNIFKFSFFRMANCCLHKPLQNGFTFIHNPGGSVHMPINEHKPVEVFDDLPADINIRGIRHVRLPLFNFRL